ncbi:ankyrin repeat ph and sec7 domain containing protein secg-related [Anaeramoeba ignava]|uniref:Ankyrin repeat ph and sec7 domain containing protein secg-related n=1 Tax=Anaeramoeba ignava TaxID=1746090 RepID=A0A9Q0LM99_ANAIG|nr:ankyrin repeat ph and sec7 domain containing protein secg-related [Anaeramoeba ignava]
MVDLYFAILEGSIEKIQECLKHENVNSKYNNTPLHFSCQMTVRENVVKFLLDSGADVNTRNNDTPLHFACENTSNYRVIQLLLDRGAEINAENKAMPIHTASLQKANSKIIELMLDRGAKINARDNSTPLHHACKSKADYRVIKTLIARGALVNAKDLNTPLHYACKNPDQPQTVYRLLQSKADVNIKNGQTCFNFAANKKILTILNCSISIAEDLRNLFIQEEFTDYEFTVIGGKILAHQPIIECRIPHKTIAEIAQELSSQTVENAKAFIEWVYCGIVSDQYRSQVKKIASNFGIQDFPEFSSISSLIESTTLLYSKNESKDFQIISFNESIFVHKIILAARSGTYRGMFINVQDETNKVSDYSKRSPQAIRAVIKFLYTDKLDEDIPYEILAELKGADLYYQLNLNSSFRLQLQILRKKSERRNLRSNFLSNQKPDEKKK